MDVSLHEAARRSGVPEETLRRRILLGELAATPVDDDRQYLVRLTDVLPRPLVPAAAPSGRARVRWIPWAAVAIVLLLLGSCGTFSMRYTCMNCGVLRNSTETGLGSPSITLFSRTQASEMSDIISQAYPGHCRHDWALIQGSGQGIT